MKKTPPAAGLAVSAVLFALTYHLDERWLGFGGLRLALPDAWYANYFTAFFGFLLSLVSTEALGVPYLAPHPFPQQPLSEDGVLRRNFRQLSRQGFNIWQKRERGKRRS